MTKPLYNGRGWPLCYCVSCGLVKYVEPHGTRWMCPCRPGAMTEHRNVPDKYTDDMRLTYRGPRRITE